MGSNACCRFLLLSFNCLYSQEKQTAYETRTTLIFTIRYDNDSIDEQVVCHREMNVRIAIVSFLGHFYIVR
jgi:hypothetical protein